MRDQPLTKDHCCSNMSLHFYTFVRLIKDHLSCKTTFCGPMGGLSSQVSLYCLTQGNETESHFLITYDLYASEREKLLNTVAKIILNIIILTNEDISLDLTSCLNCVNDMVNDTEKIGSVTFRWQGSLSTVVLYCVNVWVFLVGYYPAK